jgi:ribonucleoside-diphosphate reductase alpha chain
MDPMPSSPFEAPIAEEIWRQKYRWSPAGGPGEATLSETFARVAAAAASVEPAHERLAWQATFQDSMARFEFIPGGRILAGAGTGRSVTLFNCFVLGRIDDDLKSIFAALSEAALTMQAGGGIGHDFSTIRPRGAPVHSIGALASGPVSFMDVWDSMCRTIMSAGQRRGAMMATLRCDHPDIADFIAAKGTAGRLTNFNLSVLVTDAFVAAVKADAAWPLVFEGKVYAEVKAQELWSSIMRANHAYAEPGVIFIDQVNGANNLAYCEEIHATNPCGEQPLPPYGACLLGSINLAQLVCQRFGPQAILDEERLAALTRVAVRLLDNVIDISNYPLPAQAAEARSKRRIGLGITGLGDALIMLGLRYDSAEGRAQAARWMGLVQTTAYRASSELAAEKGAFPAFDARAFLSRPNVKALPDDLRAAIAVNGIRNGCLTTVAPSGTISLLAGNVSSGIEPVFDFVYRRTVRGGDGQGLEETVEDYAHAAYRRMHGGQGALPAAFVTAADLTPGDHLLMQAAVQPHVDSAISKTINCPADISPGAFERIYLEAHQLGLKGCTTFRPNAVTGSVLSRGAEARLPDSADAAAGVIDEAHRAATPTGARSAGAIQAARTVSRGDIVYMSEPLARDGMLSGRTYKLKWPQSAHAFYVTINDIERDGRKRPFEIFINSKDLTHYAWTVALTRMISAVFRRGGNVSFVAEELQAIFDPQGGQWVAGTYVPSLLAAIGEIIERHLAGLETHAGDVAIVQLVHGQATQGGLSEPPKPASAGAGTDPTGVRRGGRADSGRIELCERCSSPRWRMEGGCRICLACGHSRCG